MLGFLFLTYDEILKEDVWNEYFKDIPKNNYKILVHCKSPNKIKNQNLFKKRLIPNTETSWGDFSLIKAQHLLLSIGIKNYPEITHFIFISHNTIPVNSFNNLYNYLKPKIHSIIFFTNANINNDHNIRYQYLNNPNFSKENFYIQSQWCILCKRDAIIITQNYNNIKNIFNKSIISDEHAYINYLQHYKNINVLNIKTTEVVWNNSTPHIFVNISNEYIDQLRNSNIFFLRKIKSHTNLDISKCVH